MLERAGEHARDQVALALGRMLRDRQSSCLVHSAVGIRERDLEAAHRHGECHRGLNFATDSQTTAIAPRCVVGDRRVVAKRYEATMPRRWHAGCTVLHHDQAARLGARERPRPRLAADADRAGVRARRPVQPGEPVRDGVCRVRGCGLRGNVRRADRDARVPRLWRERDTLQLRAPPARPPVRVPRAAAARRRPHAHAQADRARAPAAVHATCATSSARSSAPTRARRSASSCRTCSITSSRLAVESPALPRLAATRRVDRPAPIAADSRGAALDAPPRDHGAPAAPPRRVRAPHRAASATSSRPSTSWSGWSPSASPARRSTASSTARSSAGCGSSTRSTRR